MAMKGQKKIVFYLLPLFDAYIKPDVYVVMRIKI